ncbi:hypothetical protein [Streptomyces abikoensis]
MSEDAASTGPWRSPALAGTVDRDDAEVRTTVRGRTQVLNALREPQGVV